jgi:galactonate dehydratase
MRITKLETFLMQAGAPNDTAWASDGKGHQVGARNWLFVRISTDAGLTGIGECSGWPRVIEAAVQDFRELLIGEDPMAIERLWQKLYVAMMGHGMTGIVGSGALTGIDMALWDIKGKALGTPVWNLLGGKMRDRVRIYTHASTPEVAREVVASGITAIKTGGVARPLDKVAQIRAAVGPEVDLMVDLHGPPWMTPAEAIVLGRALEPYKLLFIEDPVMPELTDAYERIRDAIGVPLAAGERLGTIWGLRSLIERDLVAVVQPDTGRAGGLTQMKKIAGMAEAHGITVAPHSGSLGPVAEFAAVHLMAAIPNALMLERIENDWPGRDEVLTEHLTLKDGHLSVPDRPGLGVDIDEDFVRRHPSVRNVAVAGGGYEKGTEAETVYFQSRRAHAKVFR